jgi:hypothetical protein
MLSPLCGLFDPPKGSSHHCGHNWVTDRQKPGRKWPGTTDFPDFNPQVMVSEWSYLLWNTPYCNENRQKNKGKTRIKDVFLAGDPFCSRCIRIK